jgi:hypothetical protein
MSAKRPAKCTRKSGRRLPLLKSESIERLKASNVAAAELGKLGRLLRTNEAATYLTDALGIPTSPGHLANLRVTGGGPTFRRAGRYITYAIAALEQYAKKHLGPEQSSTSSRKVA